MVAGEPSSPEEATILVLGLDYPVNRTVLGPRTVVR